MRVAALDLGTNTFILLIADVSDRKIERVIHDEVRVVRLGQGVHLSRRFHPEALERAEECFKRFRDVINRHQVERVLACATSAARDVSNGPELIALASRYDIPIQIISGEREAELTFWGTIREDLEGPVVIIDVGGGSTELILGDHTGLIARTSVDVGAVRLTEMFVTAHPIAPIEMAKMTSYIQEHLRKARAQIPADQETRLIAVAGTPTSLAAIDQAQPFDVNRVDGYKLPLGRVRQWVQRLAEMTVAERQALAGMEPKRADVLPAGSLILMLSSQAFQARELEVSVRGLRYGLARSLGKE
jgi:exopolyphosphatase/guanosine-5'-triphosphate,3'-diphosphate pyrophosphatase